jgi:hypothetical protein
VAWSVSLIWPGCYDDDDDVDVVGGQPRFRDPNWPTWRVRVSSPELVATLGALGCGALLAQGGDEIPAEEHQWVSPDDLIAAAMRLGELVRARSESVAAVVREYGDEYERGGAIEDQLCEDLGVVVRMAEWARALGKTLVGFDVQY